MTTSKKFAAGQTVNGRTICGARKKNGEPCGAHPARGATRCRRHGGASPQAKRKATERVVEAEVREVLGTIDPSAPQLHPVETLLQLIQYKHAEVIWLRSVVRDFREQELAWGVVQHEYGMSAEGPIDKKVESAQQNVWWKLLREAENQLATWTAAAAKAGIDERQVKIREAEALAFAGVIHRIIQRLQLTPEQASMIATIVPEELRALEGAAV
ncbi:HGGxSTG domain-containing protein [Citricoccus sp. NR2]|uniref:HGGxSTG domain-containing protein n=1 Tax=Citricoccus sp. NR2 TaxID=3004095 RepID=UPI0022DCFDCC|nr:HGGxSTG domain-containing protein [Citricoccus sp. NR2]WBL18504.1 HGGxSTG domain-containing protein [Citricoccus sp. NR2]